MKYVTLLRGINVGKSRWVDMKRIRAVFESLGYYKVITYINSGNIIFDTDDPCEKLKPDIEKALEAETGYDIPALVISLVELKELAERIPCEWLNDENQKTDVAFLFPGMDPEKTIRELPVKKDYIEIRFYRNVIFWNIDRKNLNKSQLSKISGHKLYQSMTVRNINTIRYLAAL